MEDSVVRKRELEEVDFLLERSFEEDAVFNDITSLALVSGKRIKSAIITRQTCVVAGVAFLPAIFGKRDKKISVKILKKDGSVARKNSVICEITGDAASIFSVERIALNLIGFLSGIATKTRRLRKIAEANWKKGRIPAILDTRKTVPGLRYLSKYAVRCGGGKNHRFDLAERAMIKDSHKAVSGINSAVCKTPSGEVIFEADNEKEAEKILRIKPFVILCDNFSPARLKKVVRMRNKISPGTLIEISGGVDERTIAKYKNIPIDRISSGSITHSAGFIDFSLEVRKAKSE
ncbi:MAG: carboxylating nicotinate-nucleotide diphosphorylase [Elusimicrobia bacterium]|nr:carboxylating nicotinate-nucleotide diphosphorylase [Elusimicrobiota bacterium]